MPSLVRCAVVRDFGAIVRELLWITFGDPKRSDIFHIIHRLRLAQAKVIHNLRSLTMAHLSLTMAPNSLTMARNFADSALFHC